MLDIGVSHEIEDVSYEKLPIDVNESSLLFVQFGKLTNPSLPR